MIAQVIGSVDFVTILIPVEINARLIIIAADIVKAKIIDITLIFN